MKVCGLDECGRGALAGPLVAAAVVLKTRHLISNLDDSKRLNKIQRKRVYMQIVDSKAEIEVETISARQINNRGIAWANKEIFKRLIKRIEADKYIVDGNLKLGKIKHKADRIKSMVRADRIRRCVMAASVVAKITRDRQMIQLHEEYPHFGWKQNAGYGTHRHIQAIKKFGLVKYHRGVYVTTALRKVMADD